MTFPQKLIYIPIMKNHSILVHRLCTAGKRHRGYSIILRYHQIPRFYQIDQLHINAVAALVHGNYLTIRWKNMRRIGHQYNRNFFLFLPVATLFSIQDIRPHQSIFSAWFKSRRQTFPKGRRHFLQESAVSIYPPAPKTERLKFPLPVHPTENLFQIKPCPADGNV